MYIDRIDIVLPEANIATILAAYTGAEALLEPLPAVSKADRKHYAKLGLKNEALALQIIEVGRANPNLIPRGIDFETIDRNITARAQLKLLKIQLQRMLERVDDAMLLLGVDVYAAALSMYHCLRRSADTTSLKETVDELRRGFARPSRKKKTEADSDSAPVKAPAAEKQGTAQQRQQTPVSTEATPPVPSPVGLPSPTAPVPSLSVPAAHPSYPIGSPRVAPMVSFSFLPQNTSQLFSMSTLGSGSFVRHELPAGMVATASTQSLRQRIEVSPSGLE